MNRTYYIYAPVASWQYSICLPSPQETPQRANPYIKLEAILEAGIITDESLPLSIHLITANDDCDFAHLSPWLLDVVPPQGDPPIHRCLEAVISLAETALLDIRECLLPAAQSSEMSAQVSLVLREKTDASISDVAERSFEIIEFDYTLRHQKENM
ncbi:hypothetical protein [Trichlorobacter lovleyi]|uniref:hypothetical protein n=1 Tax=Trichlorobacter lovleyi TaxID=313985 RepID=UPI0023F352D3|nr:hypothetical protein [Trichlorobacter lovleyi]